MQKNESTHLFPAGWTGVILFCQAELLGLCRLSSRSSSLLLVCRLEPGEQIIFLLLKLKELIVPSAQWEERVDRFLYRLLSG